MATAIPPVLARIFSETESPAASSAAEFIRKPEESLRMDWAMEVSAVYRK
jgi:hypothetical protein